MLRFWSIIINIAFNISIIVNIIIKTFIFLINNIFIKDTIYIIFINISYFIYIII